MRPTTCQRPRCGYLTLLVLALAYCSAPAHARWFDGNWPYRRPIDVTWDEQKASGEELAMAEFYSAGHHKPDGADIRIVTEAGKIVPFRVLQVGPGDRIRVIFTLQPLTRRYYAYFGHPNPAPAPKGSEIANIRAGLLLEMRRVPNTAGNVEKFDQFEPFFAKCHQEIGQTMVERPFVGSNPFGDFSPTVSRYSGTLFAPVDGDYTFAISADNRGGLFIDGRPLVLSLTRIHDIRYNAKINLKRGRHDFVLYSISREWDIRVTVGWKTPATDAIRPIDRAAFGILYHGIPGRLEQSERTFIADFKVEYLGEAFFADHLSHRYRFTILPAAPTVKPQYELDYGDGQTTSALESEHVYLADGVYPVRLTMKFLASNDTQTTRFPVSRQYERRDNPATDEPLVHSKIVENYALDKMPIDALVYATLLHQRSGRIAAMVAAGDRLAAEPSHPDPTAAMSALTEITKFSLTRRKDERVLKMWSRVPPNSDLQPKAVRQYADLLLWWAADFDAALKALQPYSKATELRRIYAQALILNQKADEGRKILTELAVHDSPERQAAISGALARSIEFYTEEKDWETGETVWDRWQRDYPADFLEGYSILLRVRLMTLRDANEEAAKVAEAFALAMPKSSYSPQLLNLASKLLAKSNPDKSKLLRQTLKQRYPEDPLSQGD